MTSHSHIVRSVILLACTFFSWVANAQDEYVEAVTLKNSSGNEGKIYHYTKSVTLSPPFVASGANGSFRVTPIPINPPPSLNENFLRVEVPKIAVTSEKDLTHMGPNDKSIFYSYSDGAGRSSMSTAVQSGPEYESIIQPNFYEEATGRPVKSYMSFASDENTGQFIANAFEESESFYSGPPSATIDSDGSPFASTEYDERGRVKAVIAPGQSWHSNGKRTQFDYFIHRVGAENLDENFKVFHWKIVGGKPQNDGIYGPNELSVVVAVDPQERKTRTVKDLRGLTITTQVYDPIEENWFGSYNVYDDFGRLAFVVPPILAANLGSPYPNTFTDAQVSEYMFQYRYDKRGRVIETKAPGAPWYYNVYDEWDRLVMSRYDGQQWEGSNSWTFYKYDALNREIMSGQVKTNDSRSTVQNKVPGDARYETLPVNSAQYTVNRSFPRLGFEDPGSGDDPQPVSSPGLLIPLDYQDFELLTYDYYDNYNFLNDNGWDIEHNESEYSPKSSPGFSGSTVNSALDFGTGSRIRVLGTDKWINNVFYYDNEYRLLQAITENHLQEIDWMFNEYDWEGKVLKSYYEYNHVNDAVSSLKEYSYDHEGRLLEIFQTLEPYGTSPDRVLLASYSYNMIGDLVEKKLHSTNNGGSFLQSVDYRYNIQGAMTSINDPDNVSPNGDVFGMGIFYEKPSPIEGADNQQIYNGLMNAVEWNATAATNAVDPEAPLDGSKKHGYEYKYDARNRLKSTKYAEGVEGSSSLSTNVNHYNMTATYDDNGNIDVLTRKSNNNTIDNIDYTYLANTNRLSNTIDSAPHPGGLDDSNSGVDFQYNDQGNMDANFNKGLFINYNHLMLADLILLTDGTEIHYSYDALGNKLAKEVKDASGATLTRIDYLGASEFVDGTFRQLFTKEGRVYKQVGEYYYEYIIKDHQENNRISFGDIPDINVYLATMEDDRSDYEKSEFVFPSSNNPTTSENHTVGGRKSISLSGYFLLGGSRSLGPMKVLEISQGDKVTIDTYAKYSGTFSSNPGNIASAFITAFNQASISTGVEGGGAAVEELLDLPQLFQGWDNQSGEPEAYLQYIFFDEDYNFNENGSGYQTVGINCQGEFGKLSSGQLSFDQSGYLLVYIVNESANDNKAVYFDDLKITHASAESSFRVTQINDYYPFGLPTTHSWRAPNYSDPGLLYQSSYADYDSLTGFYDFPSRSYDPELGRFFAVDPAGQFSSAYLGMGNVPHMSIDPTGEVVWFAPLVGAIVKGAFIGAGIAAATYTASTAISGDTWSITQFGKSIRYGAVSGAVTGGVGHGFGEVGSLGHELARAGVHGATQQGVGLFFGNELSLVGFASSAGGSLLGSGLHNAKTVEQIAGSAIFGGVISEIFEPGTFVQGFTTAGIVAGANHAVHGVNRRVKVRKHAKAVRAFLEDSGFSTEKVNSDVVTQKDNFFGKYYAKFVGEVGTYGDFFTGGEWDSYSSTNDAYISKSRSLKIGSPKDGLRKTLALKYYPSRSHSIGLTQTGVDHFYEAFLEGLDGKIREWTGYDNVIYDLHGYNTNFYLRFRESFK